jgi:hypothetical protein
MKSGAEIYKELNAGIEEARQRANGEARELERLGAELQAARNSEAEQTRQLASLRLGMLGSEQIVAGLDEADRRALTLLAERTSKAQSLGSQIAASLEQQRALSDRRSELLAEHDRLLAGLDDSVQACRATLAATTVYRDARAAFEQAQSRAEHADQKATQTEQDRSQKRLPYEADRLFMYLWQRRYAFPEYRALAPIRALDGWVAGLVGYETAHRNYRMLLALADRIREHAIRQQDEADACAERLAELDEQALAAAGVPALAETVEQARDRVAAAERELEAEEQRHQQQLAEQAAIAAGNDVYTLAALQALEAQLVNESLDTLRQDARATASAGDDAAVARLANCRAQTSTLLNRVNELQASQQHTLSRLREAEELRVRFRTATYDARDSQFDDGIAIGALLGQVLQGIAVADEVWRTLSGKQKFRIPRGSSGGWSGGSSRPSSWGGSSGSRSSGGFRTGGSFGGGKFKTGGGF